MMSPGPATARLGANGKLPPVGNSVDLKTATYTDAIGATQLAAGWTDPDFRRGRARLLLCPCPRDTDAALEHL